MDKFVAPEAPSETYKSVSSVTRYTSQGPKLHSKAMSVVFLPTNQKRQRARNDVHKVHNEISSTLSNKLYYRQPAVETKVVDEHVSLHVMFAPRVTCLNLYSSVVLSYMYVRML